LGNGAKRRSFSGDADHRILRPQAFFMACWLITSLLREACGRNPAQRSGKVVRGSAPGLEFGSAVHFEGSGECFWLFEHYDERPAAE
jgi:hypothetical protein